MLRRRLARAAAPDQGFTLIELLVVVLLIGVLSGIAMPVFFTQRDRARVAALRSDLRNAAISMELGSTINSGVYVASALDGFRGSAAVVRQLVVQPDWYCIEVEHIRLPGQPYTYDSTTGVQAGPGATCGAANGAGGGAGDGAGGDGQDGDDRGGAMGGDGDVQDPDCRRRPGNGVEPPGRAVGRPPTC